MRNSPFNAKTTIVAALLGLSIGTAWGADPDGGGTPAFDSWSDASPARRTISSNLSTPQKMANGVMPEYSGTGEDTDPPEVLPLSPPDGALAVARQSAIYVRLSDETGVDLSSVSLSINHRPAVDVNDPRLTFVDDVLVYTPATFESLGGCGETIVVELSVSDVLGYELSEFTWSFQLELETILREGVILTGASPGSLPEEYDGSHLTLLSRNGDIFVFRYAGVSSKLVTGSILVSVDASNPYKCVILELAEDPVAQTATVWTETVSVNALLEQGSIRFEGSLQGLTDDSNDLSTASFLHKVALGSFATGAASLEPEIGLNLARGPGWLGVAIPVEVPLDDTTIFGKGGFAVKIPEGRFELLPRFWISGNLYNWRAPEFTSQFSVDLTLDMNVRATAEFEWSDEGELPLWSAKAIIPASIPLPFFPYAIPVDVVASFDVGAGFEATVLAQGTVSTDVHAFHALRVTSTLKDGQWSHTPYRRGSITATEPDTEALAAACLKAYVKPKLGLLVVGLVGPELSLTPYLKLGGAAGAINGQAARSFNLIGGLEGEFDVELFGLDSEHRPGPWTLFDYQKLLWGLENTFPGGQADAPDETTVHLSAHQEGAVYELTINNEIEHEIAINFDVSLGITPEDPVAGSEAILANSATIVGSIDIWGTATESRPFSETEILSFGASKGYHSLVSFPCMTELDLRTGELLTLSTALLNCDPIVSDGIVPYRLEYDGRQQQLTLWVRLLSPFVYPADYEWYAMKANAAVSGLSGRFEGYVTDCDSSDPIPTATVELASGEEAITVMTDGCGWFLVDKVPAGPLRVTISKEGYETFSQTKLMPAAGRVHQDFCLQPSQ